MMSDQTIPKVVMTNSATVVPAGSYINDVIAWLRDRADQPQPEWPASQWAASSRMMADWMERHREDFAGATRLVGDERLVVAWWLRETENAPAFCSPPWGRNFTGAVAEALRKAKIG